MAKWTGELALLGEKNVYFQPGSAPCSRSLLCPQIAVAGSAQPKWKGGRKEVLKRALWSSNCAIALPPSQEMYRSGNIISQQLVQTRGTQDLKQV